MNLATEIHSPLWIRLETRETTLLEKLLFDGSDIVESFNEHRQIVQQNYLDNSGEK